MAMTSKLSIQLLFEFPYFTSPRDVLFVCWSAECGQDDAAEQHPVPGQRQLHDALREHSGHQPLHHPLRRRSEAAAQEAEEERHGPGAGWRDGGDVEELLHRGGGEDNVRRRHIQLVPNLVRW